MISQHLFYYFTGRRVCLSHVHILFLCQSCLSFFFSFFFFTLYIPFVHTFWFSPIPFSLTSHLSQAFLPLQQLHYFVPLLPPAMHFYPRWACKHSEWVKLSLWIRSLKWATLGGSTQSPCSTTCQADFTQKDITSLGFVCLLGFLNYTVAHTYSPRFFLFLVFTCSHCFYLWRSSSQTLYYHLYSKCEIQSNCNFFNQIFALRVDQTFKYWILLQG